MTTPVLGPAPEADPVERLSGPYSAVSRKDSPLGFLVGVAGTFGLGLVVFLSLSAGRHAKAQAPPAPASPIPATVMPAPPAAQIEPPPMNPVVAAPQPTTDADEQARLRAPSMVVDLSDSQEAAAASPPAAAPAGASAAASAPATSGAREPASGSQPIGRPGSDEGFAERVSGSQVDTAHATHLANTSLIAPQGTVISAVLETGINSDLPGFVRAVVSRDVRGFDGSTVLIPRGSKLIGEYKSGVAQGQSRAFVIWSRLLTPSGISVNLGSPATDRLGRGGIDGETNTHFLHRFGAAILLSVISAGLEALANQGSGNVNAIVIGTPQVASNVATVALQRDIDIPVTITVPQGQAIRVFVSRDLDFTDVIQAR